jgi:hypothetical protein
LPTLTTLQNRVQSILGLETSGNELTLLTGYLNEGYTDVLVRTRCRTNCGDLTTIANTWKYRLPSAILAVLEMWTEDVTYGTTTTFMRTSTEEIIRLRRGQQATISGNPTYYSVEGHDMLMIYPTPTTAGVIEYLYCPRPTDMSAGSDTPSYVPAEWHRAIETYACWRMADFMDDGSSGQGELYRARYEGVDGRGGLLRDIRQQNRWQGGRRLSPVKVGRRGMRVASPRSVDSW